MLTCSDRKILTWYLGVRLLLNWTSRLIIFLFSLFLSYGFDVLRHVVPDSSDRNILSGRYWDYYTILRFLCPWDSFYNMLTEACPPFLHVLASNCCPVIMAPIPNKRFFLFKQKKTGEPCPNQILSQLFTKRGKSFFFFVGKVRVEGSSIGVSGFSFFPLFLFSLMLQFTHMWTPPSFRLGTSVTVLCTNIF